MLDNLDVLGYSRLCVKLRTACMSCKYPSAYGSGILYYLAIANV
ncbi:MAG: hypothetical protein AAF959_15075 [Cyanobacteria bacterium P01_D01_bin.56]